MKANTTIWLFNFEESQDEINGTRTKIALLVTKVQAEKSPVGTQSYWDASSNHIQLAYTIQMIERAYKLQKYVYFRDKGIGRVFEVNNVGKGESEQFIKLYVKNTHEDLEGMIENVI